MRTTRSLSASGCSRPVTSTCPLGAATFDLVVSNPPYVAQGDPHLADGDVRFEPSSALVSGTDGLAALRVIVAGARPHLRAGGGLIVEHGYDQADVVRTLLQEAGFVDLTMRRDLAGIPRVAAGRVPFGVDPEP